MLDLKPNEIIGLMTLCQQTHRGKLADLCKTPQDALALMSALDELIWQLASSGHAGAIDALTV